MNSKQFNLYKRAVAVGNEVVAKALEERTVKDKDAITQAISDLTELAAGEANRVNKALILGFRLHFAARSCSSELNIFCEQFIEFYNLFVDLSQAGRMDSISYMNIVSDYLCVLCVLNKEAEARLVFSEILGDPDFSGSIKDKFRKNFPVLRGVAEKAVSVPPVVETIKLSARDNEFLNRTYRSIFFSASNGHPIEISGLVSLAVNDAIHVSSEFVHKEIIPRLSLARGLDEEKVDCHLLRLSAEIRAICVESAMSKLSVLIVFEFLFSLLNRSRVKSEASYMDKLCIFLDPENGEISMHYVGHSRGSLFKELYLDIGSRYRFLAENLGRPFLGESAGITPVSVSSLFAERARAPSEEARAGAGAAADESIHALESVVAIKKMAASLRP